MVMKIMVMMMTHPVFTSWSVHFLSACIRKR